MMPPSESPSNPEGKPDDDEIGAPPVVYAELKSELHPSGSSEMKWFDILLFPAGLILGLFLSWLVWTRLSMTDANGRLNWDYLFSLAVGKVSILLLAWMYRRKGLASGILVSMFLGAIVALLVGSCSLKGL